MGEQLLALINAFFGFFTDRSRKGIHKIFLAFSVLVFIGFINEFTGCSFYLENHFKLSQVERINKMLSDTTLPKDIKNNLITLRHETIYRLSKIDKLKQICLAFLQQGNSNSLITNTDKTPKTIIVNSRDGLVQFLTSAIGILVVMVAGLYIEIFTKDAKMKEPNTLKRLFELFGIEAVLLGIAFLQTLLLSLIPILFNHVWLNYVINILVNVIEFSLLYYVSNKPKKINAHKTTGS